MNLTEADRLADATLAHARTLGAAPLAVVVLDAGGHPVVVKREDGAGILRVEIATAKAYGALGMGMSSRDIATRAEKQPAFFTSLAAVTHGHLAPAAGGILIHDETGHLTGALGVSGDTSDVDEACALAALSRGGSGGR
ncbi:GlcG/HbpS family heme-binding protein [Paractinoplanes lichenicola]|uniref:Heme-binding protein n=1 Tax=Paractinoplanes lichenicola TaxID=2802976 RepID=A0ABS1VVR2_9ACTN|nr:heme-binding protein [Actinoplanes lichenicola]MBL7258556.1 heme-binding protein [Actinoplanes lichenicola]